MLQSTSTDPEAEAARTQKGQSAYAQADTALWAETTETTCSVAVTVQKMIIGQKAQLIGKTHIQRKA